MKRIGIISLIIMNTAGTISAQDPQWGWVWGLHTQNNELATAVASDPVTGEVYLAGLWRGDLSTVIPTGGTESTDLSSTFGGEDGMVVKLDPDGNILWAFKLGSEANDKVTDILVDETGHFYICGSLASGTGHFEGTGPPSADSEYINPGAPTAYLARYDPEGILEWVRFAGELEASEGSAIASNQEGVFLTGHHEGTVSFGDLPPYSSVGGTDLFMVRYDPDGNELWHISTGSELDDYAEDIVCDLSHLYVGGRFLGTQVLHWDLSRLLNIFLLSGTSGQAEGFVAEFTTEGFHRWTQVISSDLDDDCRGLALDSDQVFVAGTLGSEALFPMHADNPVTIKGGRDAYICALTRDDGATKWVRTLTGDLAGDQVVRDLSRDLSGGLYMTGFFTNNVTTTDIISDSKGLEDVFLAAYTRSGDEKWIKTAGSAGADMGNGVCAATPGRIYLAGEYEVEIGFDSRLLPDNNNANAFLAQLNLECMDAVGGKLTALDTVVAEGEVITLFLKEYYGDIRWEFSLPGQNNWSLLTADLRDSIEHFPSGTADYRAYVTSSNCASDSSNVVRVEVLNTIIRFADAGKDTIICPGDSIKLQASGGDFYKWDPPEGLDQPESASPWAKPRFTTDYVVHVTRMDGLTDTDTVTIHVYPHPQVNAGEDIQICLGDQVELSAVTEHTPFWFPSEGLDDPTLLNPTAQVDTTTVFGVVVIDTFGCHGYDDLTIFVIHPPRADAGADQLITAWFGTRLEATLGPGETGTWSVESGYGLFEDPRAPDTRVYDLQLGENIFRWAVTNGICPDAVARVKITVEDFLVPTVITPNGDGKNDYFHISGIEQFSNTELVVLNRWGEEVYRVSPYNNSWDGVNRNGVELPEDTYYVIVKITDDDIRKGYIMIVR